MEWIIFIGVVLAYFYFVGDKSVKTKNYQYTKKKYYNQPREHNPPKEKPNHPDYNWQLSTVNNTQFKKVPVMNRGESQVYWVLVKYLNEIKKGKYIVFSQVNLGEFLSGDKDAMPAINSKRVDLCVTGIDYYPLAVVEVNGVGHADPTSGYRESVKRIAVERSGIKYLFVKTPTTDDTIKAYLNRELLPILN